MMGASWTAYVLCQAATTCLLEVHSIQSRSGEGAWLFVQGLLISASTCMRTQRVWFFACTPHMSNVSFCAQIIVAMDVAEQAQYRWF